MLRHMNEAGVLGRFIPDFGKIVAMMQFNMYHHYTVDEHLIRSIGVLSALRTGRIAGDHPLSRRDPADDQGHDGARTSRCSCTTSPRAGRRTIRSPAPGWRGSSARGSGCRRTRPRLVAWLVEQHLTMSRIAQSRDLADRRTILDFAAHRADRWSG